MLLKKSDTGDNVVDLVMSPMEWGEVQALAKFARAAVAYDCTAPYVAQALTYTFIQPEKIQSSPDMEAAFAAIERLEAANQEGNVIFSAGKEEMRQLLIVLVLAAKAEESAERLYDALPDEFPYLFPALALPSSYYVDAFDRLLTALHENASLKIDRPVYKELNSG